MKTIKDLKNELKALAIISRELKSHRPQEKRGTWGIYDLDYKIRSTKHIIRHKHIAYCLIRGRKYDEIEHPSKDNEPNFKLIQDISKEYTNEA
jgi:hypothetical protein